MIVYGDPGFEQNFAFLLEQLRERVLSMQRRREWSGESRLDALRGLLIYAGQIEQAAWDDLPAAADADTCAALRSLTKHVTWELAAAFLAERSDAENLPSPGVSPHVARILNGVRAMLDGFTVTSFPALRAVRVRAKLPEGYAFYALYPEQYAQAAQDWAAQASPDEQKFIVVVGVRSIGTSLAAVVHRTLADSGTRVVGLTTRPNGHPFARHVAAGLGDAKGAEYALIVDEGPGMSGSSMASVAQALKDGGMDAANIAFLPGHPNDPGGQGNEDVKRWWATTPRYVTPLHDMRWNGLSLPDTLAAHTARLFGASYDAAGTHAGIDVEDFGGGLWRRVAYASEQEWPAVCAAFESTKHRITLADGTRILWKFAGLATGADGREQAYTAYQTLIRRSEAGWTVAPLGTSMGFVALPWIEGTPLVYADATPDVLQHIGRYVAAVRAPSMTPLEHDAALAWLADMLYWNVWEALGEEHAAQTRMQSDIARNAVWLPTAPTYGDGRMMPHKWLRLPDGTLMKTDGAGHDADHTIVGRQCWLWDVAGVIIEWRLSEVEADVLLRAALTDTTQEDGKQESATREDKTQEEQTVTPAILAFYCMAYAAFRAGQTHLCVQMSGHDPAEQARLWQAYALYRAQLQSLIALTP